MIPLAASSIDVNLEEVAAALGKPILSWHIKSTKNIVILNRCQSRITEIFFLCFKIGVFGAWCILVLIANAQCSYRIQILLGIGHCLQKMSH